jgi:hypothetical protein
VSAYEVETFQDDRGTDVILEFLREVRRGGGAKAAAKIERAVDLLAAQGLANPDDVVRKVRGDLWELRATFQKNPYRILFYHPGGQSFVLLAGFHKKDNAISERDIRRAEDRMREDRRRKGL